jgi:hypothetical protein
VEVRQGAGPQGGATVELTAVELRALFNIVSFVASGGVATEKPERDMAARFQIYLQRATRWASYRFPVTTSLPRLYSGRMLKAGQAPAARRDS